MALNMQENVWKKDPEWFRPWFNTPAYHILYGHRSEREAQDLIDNLSMLSEFPYPGKAIDAGCGAGRHARALGEKGWQVEAFDLSQGSIDIATAKLDNPNVSFQVMDLRELHLKTSWENQFDLVTNFFTSLGYFSSRDEQHTVINGFHRCLKSGGTLLIDYLNAPAVRANLVEQELVIREGVEFTIHRRIHEGWIDKSIQFQWQDERQHHVESVQLLTLNDFDEMLTAFGFQIKQVWGDYHMSPWHEKSPRCMFIAERTRPSRTP